MSKESLRKKNGNSYKYKLVIDGKTEWLNVSQLESHPLAVITRKAISLRINRLISGETTSYKTILDCISKSQTHKNKNNSELGDFNQLNDLWKK